MTGMLNGCVNWLQFSLMLLKWNIDNLSQWFDDTVPLCKSSYYHLCYRRNYCPDWYNIPCSVNCCDYAIEGILLINKNDILIWMRWLPSVWPTASADRRSRYFLNVCSLLGKVCLLLSCDYMSHSTLPLIGWNLLPFVRLVRFRREDWWVRVNIWVSKSEAE